MTVRRSVISEPRTAVLWAFSVLGMAAAHTLVGCALERDVARRSVGISGETFRAGAIAIAGVTVIEEVEQVRPPLIAALESTLAQERPDLSFQSADAVRMALGLPAYRRILFAYQSSGSLTDAEMSEISKALGTGVRYVVLARVEKTSVSESGRPTRNAPPMASDFYSVTREARVRITIFDVADTRVAYEAKYASSYENAVPDSLREPSRRRPFEKPDPDRAVDLRGINPDVRTPDLATTLAKAFRTFAADLPR